MQRAVQVPSALIDALLGLVVLFVVGSASVVAPVGRAGDALQPPAELQEASHGSDMSDLSRSRLLVGILTSAIRLATPYLYAAIGETFAQTSGVVNLGVDGIMLVGALRRLLRRPASPATCGWACWRPWSSGLLMGLLMSVISVTLKAEQGISGIGLYMFGLGLSSLLFKVTIGTVKTVAGFQPVKIPLLGDIPVIGPIFFQQSLPVYGAFLLVPLAWWVLDKTTWGLQDQGRGAEPGGGRFAGRERGPRPLRQRLPGRRAGRASPARRFPSALVNLFQENLTAGMGFIAVALVYFGGWRPVGIMAGALLFSIGQRVPAVDAGAWASRSRPTSRSCCPTC